MMWKIQRERKIREYGQKEEGKKKERGRETMRGAKKYDKKLIAKRLFTLNRCLRMFKIQRARESEREWKKTVNHSRSINIENYLLSRIVFLGIPRVNLHSFTLNITNGIPCMESRKRLVELSSSLQGMVGISSIPMLSFYLPLPLSLPFYLSYFRVHPEATNVRSNVFPPPPVCMSICSWWVCSFTGNSRT